MGLAGMTVSEEEAREIFDTADLDGGGTIDFEVRIDGYCPISILVAPKLAYQALAPKLA
jgi:hypothetical protein